MVFLHNHVNRNWGLVIIIFGLFLKVILIPVAIMTVKHQRKVSRVKTLLEPVLAKIKKQYDGEEAHKQVIAAHKDLGVSVFYSLKPMLGSFIQIPILIAVFNALGEMPQLAGQPFLWIEDLAYPDSIGHLPFNIFMLGDTINLLPFIMTAIAIFSTIVFQNRLASKKEIKTQKTKLYFNGYCVFSSFLSFSCGHGSLLDDS